MSKQRNKRNTRRGRAKRWKWSGKWRTREQFPVMWGRMGQAWSVDAPSRGVSYALYLTRAAAMRAAEHLARLR